MAVIPVDRNTTAVNKLQVVIKYIFDLAVDTNYPHDREINIQMLKMFRSGYILI